MSIIAPATTGNDDSTPVNQFDATLTTVKGIVENARDALTTLNNQGYDATVTTPLDIVVIRGRHLTWASPETVSLNDLNQFIQAARAAATMVEARLNIK